MAKLYIVHEVEYTDTFEEVVESAIEHRVNVLPLTELSANHYGQHHVIGERANIVSFLRDGGYDIDAFNFEDFNYVP